MESMETETRNQRRVVIGRVVSDKMDKTIVVRSEYKVPHARYGKFIRRYSTYKAHDEGNSAAIGDWVEIMETRPLSKTKCWRLVRKIDSAQGTVPSE
ncbi:MAG: 30S ribosomal protein S17 [Planctomycetota bacterium]